MSSQSTEDLNGAANSDNKEEPSGEVNIMDSDNSKVEMDKANTAHSEEKSADHSPAIDAVIKNSEELSASSVINEEEPLATKLSKPDVSDTDINSDASSACDMDVCGSSEAVSNRTVGDPNRDSEVLMDTTSTANHVDIEDDSPKKANPTDQSVSKILSSTPTKVSAATCVIVSDSQQGSPEDVLDVHISDDDDIVELADGTDQTFKGAHRGIVVPYSDTDDSDSSSSESESETSSDSSSSDCEVDLESSLTKNKSSQNPKPVKIRGELDIEDLPPIQDLHISVRNDQAVEIGKVLHAVDTLVVVECYKDQPPLDIDSVLFLDSGARPLGRIFDVMGPVTEPLYCVRFNSKEHIEEQNIQPGMLVYSAPQTEHSQFVFVKHLMMMKGSDASWKKDKEVPGTELDFSDDEVEAEIRRASNNRPGYSPNKADEPKRKISKPGQSLPGGRFQAIPNGPRGQGRDNYRPRNPWGWSGARFNVSNNIQCHPPTHPNQFSGRGFVRPPSFNTDTTLQIRPPHTNHQNNQYMHPSNTQYMQNSSCGNYGPSSEYSSYQQGSHDYTAGNGYSYGTEYSQGMDYSQAQNAYPPHNTPDQRYQAFQSEIAKLVDAYNRGVDSPMAVGTATYGMQPPPQFGVRPPGPRPQFGGRPPGPHSQFAGPPPGPRPQFGVRPTGPRPQFGSRPPGPTYNNQFYS